MSDLLNMFAIAYETGLIIKFVLLILSVLSAVGLVICVMLTPSTSSGLGAISGSSESFYSKNKGKSIESRRKMWTIIFAVCLCVFMVLFFVFGVTTAAQ